MCSALRMRADDFVIGFAGSLTDEKGWRVLVQALEALPQEFRLVMAGDGPQRGELRGDGVVGPARRPAPTWGFCPRRAVGLLPGAGLPRDSVDDHRPLEEQFGGALCDAIVMGLPIVGLVERRHSRGDRARRPRRPGRRRRALAEALVRLRDDPELRTRLGRPAGTRFRTEFAIPAYADKIATALRLHARG